MPIWTTFRKIHIHIRTKLFLMKEMTIEIHMVNTGLETIHKTAEKKQAEGMCSNMRVVNEIINVGVNIVKTR